MARLRIFLGAVLAWFGAARLGAHSAPGSAVLLDFRGDRIEAELRLPLSELELAFGAKLQTEPAQVVARHGSALADYVLRHVRLEAPDGRRWSADIGAMAVALGEEPVDLVVRAALRPPAGAELRRFRLHYDVVSHEVMNHQVLVSVRRDWNRARFGGEPELLGVLRSYQRELDVDRAEGSPWRGFRSVLALGARHIAEGTDHLLFLLVLLLPAPLAAAGGRWGGAVGTRAGAVGLLKVVTAFTVGHSATLAAGALAWLRLPAAPVEAAIAGSILVSAVHAWRPIFPGREPLVAAGFGLVHGLAFAGVLADLQLEAGQFAAALAAFNLGIELMQLAVVAATVPWLLLLARVPSYRWIRQMGAVGGATAALGWLGERTLGWANPVGGAVEALAAHAGWGAAALALVAVAATLRQRRAGVPAA